MRKLFLKLHLYAGLLCFPYFIIFGISSLHINHAFPFMKPAESMRQWQRDVPIRELDDNQQLAETIRDSLGLMGWAPWWEQNRQADAYNFQVTHPGKQYRIRAYLQENRVVVEEQSKGFWPVLNALHFVGESIPGAPVPINSWQYYQDFCVFVLVFSILSGVYLFVKRRQETWTGLLILGGCTFVSLLLMVGVWLGN